MTVTLDEFIANADNYRHHALLLLCPRFEGERGLPAQAFMRIARAFCGVDLLLGEDEESFWTQASAHPDVVIVDRERRTLRLEEVESIRAKAQFRPTLGKKRLFFIDRCERLGPNSANSLLKTLEEPDVECLFLLTARRESEVLDTIVSRCQKVAINIAELERLSPKTRLESEDFAWLQKQFSSPQGNMTVATESTWDGGLKVDAQTLAGFVEHADLLAKKYSGADLQAAVAQLVAEHWNAASPGRSRLLASELARWLDAEAFNVSTSLWLLRLLLLAQGR